MIKGIGIDLIEIDRIKKAVEKYGDSFLEKVFTEQELKYCKNRKALKYPELAVRFAAKEAYAKALGTGISGFGRNNQGIAWQDVEVVNDSQGKPQVCLKGKLAKKVQLSLSHSRDSAVAVVVLG